MPSEVVVHDRHGHSMTHAWGQGLGYMRGRSMSYTGAFLPGPIDNTVYQEILCC